MAEVCLCVGLLLYFGLASFRGKSFLLEVTSCLASKWCHFEVPSGVWPCKRERILDSIYFNYYQKLLLDTPNTNQIDCKDLQILVVK